jgi:hypothetical protein
MSTSSTSTPVLRRNSASNRQGPPVMSPESNRVNDAWGFDVNVPVPQRPSTVAQNQASTIEIIDPMERDTCAGSLIEYSSEISIGKRVSFSGLVRSVKKVNIQKRTSSTGGRGRHKHIWVIVVQDEAQISAGYFTHIKVWCGKQELSSVDINRGLTHDGDRPQLCVHQPEEVEGYVGNVLQVRNAMVVKPLGRYAVHGDTYVNSWPDRHEHDGVVGVRCFCNMIAPPTVNVPHLQPLTIRTRRLMEWSYVHNTDYYKERQFCPANRLEVQPSQTTRQATPAESTSRTTGRQATRPESSSRSTACTAPQTLPTSVASSSNPTAVPIGRSLDCEADEEDEHEEDVEYSRRATGKKRSVNEMQSFDEGSIGN